MLGRLTSGSDTTAQAADGLRKFVKCKGFTLRLDRVRIAQGARSFRARGVIACCVCRVVSGRLGPL